MSHNARITSCLAMLFVAALLTAPFSLAHAGTICGTVRDADTSLPVAQAAVFLYDNNGDYTGIHAGTDGAGMYCLDNVPVGTYTVEVRRDDYVTVIIPDVEVTDTSTSVNVVAHPGLRLRAWPNPASDRVQFELGAPEGAPVTLEVYDIKGRLVRGWRGTGSGMHTLDWDLRDPQGNRITAGVYLVRLQSGDRHITRRLVHFR